MESPEDCLSPFWPISRILLNKILEDRISDSFVAERIWERLGYEKGSERIGGEWKAGILTPDDWKQAFPSAPAVIAQRQASVKLTRSIPKKFKQLLKSQLNFSGYRIGELYPRRTRRATAVNWLLAWLAERGQDLDEVGPIPKCMEPPGCPLQGHPGDPPVE